MRFAVIALMGLAIVACEEKSKPHAATATPTATATATATTTTTTTTTATTTTTTTATASAAPSASAAPDAGNGDYLVVTNSRYRFSVEIPTVFKANPPDANGAGQSFTYKGSKAYIHTLGAVNSTGMNAKELFEDWARRPGLKEKSFDGNVWVIGGVEGGKAYWSRGELFGKTRMSVDMEYDPSLEETMAPVKKHILETFKDRLE